MKITILGAGAMGSLFGSLLSVENDVTLVDLNKDLVSAINNKGVSVKEKDKSNLFNDVFNFWNDS